MGWLRVKVLLISGIYFPDIGGPATYIPRLASAFMEKGFEVQTLSLSDLKHSNRPKEAWQRDFVLRNTNKLKRTFQLVRKIRREAKNVDFVFANGLFIETAIALLGIKCYPTAKIVGDPVWERLNNKKHTDISVEEFAVSYTGIKNYIQRRIVNLALSRFYQLTAPSQNLANTIQNWGIRKRVEVIPNGVKCLEVTDMPVDYDVVSLARLVSWKRIDLLIKACAIANLRLAIAGDGPERNSLEQLAFQKGCNAEFLGQLDRERSINLLRRSKIFALISSYEGLSFALVEAMMLEKRILVSNAPGNLEAITDQSEGLVALKLTARGIADNLKELNSENRQMLEMGKHARKRAQKRFCEERQLSAMINFITGPKK